MTGKLLLMEDVTQLKVVDISTQDISQREYQQEPHKTSDYQRKKKKKRTQHPSFKKMK